MFNLMALKKTVEQGLASFGIPLDDNLVEGICQYVAELARWNERMNLVGMNDGESVVRELLYDSFFLYGYVGQSESILDLGSGAGVLAIPLALLNEKTRVFSVDKTLKKIQFQRHVKRTMKLANFFPIHSRVESLEPLDIESLVAKAFGGITDTLMKGGRHIKKWGHAFLLKGKTQQSEFVDGFSLEEIIPYVLPDSTKARTLFVYAKI